MLPQVLYSRAKLPARVSPPGGMNSADQWTVLDSNSPKPADHSVACQAEGDCLAFPMSCKGVFGLLCDEIALKQPCSRPCETTVGVNGGK